MERCACGWHSKTTGQTLELARSGAFGAAAANAALSLVSCLAAVWLGFAAGALFNR